MGRCHVETLIRRCAGLDVHKASVVACVRLIDENGELLSFTQSFGTTTSDLLKLNDWLMSYSVTIVGMESTGVYWKPVYTLLETEFECWLLNAQHLRTEKQTHHRNAVLARMLVDALVSQRDVFAKKTVPQPASCRSHFLSSRTSPKSRLMTSRMSGSSFA